MTDTTWEDIQRTEREAPVTDEGSSVRCARLPSKTRQQKRQVLLLDQRSEAEERERMVEKLAEWIDVNALAVGLYKNLASAKDKYDVTAPNTLDELQSLYMGVLRRKR